ncbi:MAG: 30S ribosomal protein S17 [Candidatus Pacebacteria bacterium]|nr:30S ribosomal protein S17 [Candidatus Paceibacterota bacterium]
MKTIQGTVVSLKTAKTAAVLVTRQWQHPLYKKYVKRTKKHPCHYQGLELVEGDEVLIEPCRPMSKTKHFQVVAKIEGDKLVKAKKLVQSGLKSAGQNGSQSQTSATTTSKTTKSKSKTAAKKTASTTATKSKSAKSKSAKAAKKSSKKTKKKSTKTKKTK